MSNLLIEISAIGTFPKSSSSKRSSGNFGASLSSPFPKARNLKQRSLKMFVLRLFNKFTPLYPTPMGCRRFHSTHKVGLWTLLTSNPSNVLLAVLKTGENGGWLTAVVHWHMRYLLRRISRRRRDRASELCAKPFVLSSRTVFGCGGAPCAVHCLVPPRAIVKHVERSRASTLTTPTSTFTNIHHALNLSSCSTNHTPIRSLRSRHRSSCDSVARLHLGAPHIRLSWG
jgi:hypothetical protein